MQITNQTKGLPIAGIENVATIEIAIVSPITFTNELRHIFTTSKPQPINGSCMKSKHLRTRSVTPIIVNECHNYLKNI